MECWGLWVLSCFGHVQLFATQWTVAHQAPLLMGFFRQEYWSGLPCPPPGDLPNPGIKPMSFLSPALAAGFATTSTTWEALWVERSPIFIDCQALQKLTAHSAHPIEGTVSPFQALVQIHSCVSLQSPSLRVIQKLPQTSFLNIEQKVRKKHLHQRSQRNA